MNLKKASYHKKINLPSPKNIKYKNYRSSRLEKNTSLVKIAKKKCFGV